MNPKIKDIVGVALVLALVVGAYAAVVYSKSMRPGEYREFSVTGTGEIVSVPDIGQFSFSVLTEGGKDLNALQKQNTDKINKAIEFVKAKGVDAKDIKTTGYDVSPRYSSCNSPNFPCSSTIEGYTIRQSVSVKMRDFPKIGDIMSGVVTNGANEVSSLNFTIDDPSKLQGEAREKAVAQAREKAEAIAKAGGFKLGRLVGIEEGGGYYPPPYYAEGRGGDAMMANEAKLSAPAIEPGSEDVNITVILRYQIR